MARSHIFKATTTWTGNRGQGTANYKAYGRTHEVAIEGKPLLAGSADPMFHGEADRWNPEDSLLSSISACHMLSFLHVATRAGWVVESYEDKAEAAMVMNPDGSGQFSSATLHPVVTISAGDLGLSEELHHKAHELCFIARSVNFDVACEAIVTQV